MNNISFIKKMEKVRGELRRYIGEFNKENTELMAAYLDKHIGLEDFVSSLQAHDINYMEYRIFLKILMSSEIFKYKTIQLMSFNDSHSVAYNLLVESLGESGYTPPTPVLMDSMKLLSAKLKGRTLAIRKAVFHKAAEDTFDCLIEAFGSSDEVIKNMSFREIAACVKFLPRYGYSAFDSPHIPKEIPYSQWFIRDGYSREVIKPIYDLLAVLKSPYEAQKTIDEVKSANRIVFVTVSDLSEYTGNDPVAFIQSAVSSKSDLYDKFLPLAIGAMRNDDRIGELDCLGQKILKALYKERLLTDDDLKLMPNALNANKHEVLSNGLGL